MLSMHSDATNMLVVTSLIYNFDLTNLSVSDSAWIDAGYFREGSTAGACVLYCMCIVYLFVTGFTRILFKIGCYVSPLRHLGIPVIKNFKENFLITRSYLRVIYRVREATICFLLHV